MNLDDLNDLEPARLPFPVTRSVGDAPVLEGDTAPHIVGRFSTFGDPYEIDSHIEGRFLEQIAPGAFRKTIAESRNQMKVLFDHGQDPQMGNMVLGKIESLSDDAAYDVAAFDGIPPLLLNGLRAGAYGSSFRFSVEKDVWDYTPDRSDANPDGIPERTITEARVFEFGPVTFPANPAATAGVRSTTDSFYQRSRDPEAFETLLRSAQVARAPKGVTSTEPPPSTPPEPLRSDTPPEPSPTRAAGTEDPLKGGSLDSGVRTVEQDYTAPEDRESRINELRSGIERMATENTGTLSVELQARWDADTSELRKHEADKAAYEQRMALVRSIAATVPAEQQSGFAYNVHLPNVRKDQGDIYDMDRIRKEARSLDDVKTRIRENALRSIDSHANLRNANPGALADIVEHGDEGADGEGEISRRVLATGSPVYRRAFNKYLKGQTALWTAEESRAAALAVTATTTTGGYAVPYVFDPTMIHIGVWTPQNPYRAACRVETITNGNVWKTVTTSEILAAYGTEATALIEGGPTFGQPSYQVQTARAFVTLSIETLEDRPDMTQELTSLFAEAKDTLEEGQFSLGTGSTVFPFGMFTAAAYTAVTTATSDVTAISDTVLVEAGLPLRHRANAAWFMSKSTIRQLLALDTTGRYFSGAGINYPGNQNPTIPAPGSGNTGLKLIGYPVWEAPSAVSTLTTDAAIIGWLGDPKSYVIVDRIGMNVEVIPQMTNGATPSFPTLQRGVVCYWRNTAKPINADAGRTMKVA